MAVNETIVTGRAKRVLIDKATKLWQRISEWTKASDVEFNDGNTAETKVGAIDGITDSLVSTSSRIAASAKAVKELNNHLTALTDSGAIKGLDAREDGVYITYVPSNGADSVTKKLGANSSKKIRVIERQYTSNPHFTITDTDNHFYIICSSSTGTTLGGAGTVYENGEWVSVGILFTPDLSINISYTKNVVIDQMVKNGNVYSIKNNTWSAYYWLMIIE